MIWIKRILSANIIAYAALMALFALTLDHAKVQDQRSRYLLGIFYNGFFKNYKDGIVYCDYMVRVDPKNPQHYANLAECYSRMGDEQRAAKYRSMQRSIQ